MPRQRNSQRRKFKWSNRIVIQGDYTSRVTRYCVSAAFHQEILSKRYNFRRASLSRTKKSHHGDVNRILVCCALYGFGRDALIFLRVPS